MQYLMAPIKFLLIIVGIIAYFMASFIVGLIVWDFWQLRVARARLISMSSKYGLWVLGVKVNFKGEDLDRSRAHLIVSNHLSYLDILVMASVLPTAFVTSREVEKTPVLGQMCKMGGCLFVERRSREFLDQEIREITDALKYGLNVTIFPEATSTNGEQVLRFKRPLYNAAILSNSDTLALCINYDSIDDQAVTRSNRDKVFWYGDMSFLPHLWILTTLREIKVSLTNLGTAKTQDEVNCNVLAEVTHKMVSEHFVTL
ncbi:MAG: 1-acyl-sn-glycerol-3-phosphate acyltransferase [Bdellovibrionales bacterium]